MVNLTAKRKSMVDAMMRDAIYEGTLAVLAKYGLAGTTMDRVAAAAEVAKGSLYNYFSGKDELLGFVHRKTVQPLLDMNHEIAAATDMTATEKVSAMIRRWRSYIGEQRAVFELLIRDNIADGILKETTRVINADVVRVIGGVIEEGIARGEFRPVNSKVAAEMLLGASKGTHEAEFAEGVHRSDEEIVGTLISVFLRGLCTD